MLTSENSSKPYWDLSASYNFIHVQIICALQQSYTYYFSLFLYLSKLAQLPVRLSFHSLKRIPAH